MRKSAFRLVLLASLAANPLAHAAEATDVTREVQVYRGFFAQSDVDCALYQTQSELEAGAKGWTGKMPMIDFSTQRVVLVARRELKKDLELKSVTKAAGKIEISWKVVDTPGKGESVSGSSADFSSSAPLSMMLIVAPSSLLFGLNISCVGA